MLCDIGFSLVTCYYEPANGKRLEEIRRCLQKNVDNDMIGCVYLLNDRMYDMGFLEDVGGKVKQLVVDDDNRERLSFKYAFDFCNRELKEGLCIIANSDIYFDETLMFLDEVDFVNTKTLIALSRYDNGRLFNNPFSQDCWIFRAPIGFDTEELNFKFGILGCDNVIAEVFRKNGYYVANPSKVIRSHHMHQSNYRTYTNEDRIWGRYYLVAPTGLHEMIQGRMINYKRGENGGAIMEYL